MASFGMTNFSQNSSSMVKYNMGQVISSMCKHTGIHECIDNTFLKVANYHVTEASDEFCIQSRIERSASRFGITLSRMQVKSIFNIVWRPECSMKIKATFPKSMVRSFRSPLNDAGSPVLLDLPTGMGKTFVCILSCLLLSTERRFHTVLPRTSNFSNVGIESVVSGPVGGARTSIVFSPKHLHNQWIKEALDAKDVIEDMYNSCSIKWKVHIFINKKSSEIKLLDDEVAIIICDSSSFGPTKILEEEEWYASICYDECAEQSKSSANSATCKLGNVFYGRIIFCSADFSKLSTTFTSSRDGCAMKTALGINTQSDLGIVVKGRYPRSYMTKEQMFSAMGFLSVLYSASVLPGSYRSSVLQESCDLLGDTGLYTVRIPYIGTVMEALGTNVGHDVNGSDGAFRFHEMFGVNINRCKTVGDIIHRLENSDSLSVESKSRLILKLTSMSSEDCPICFNKIDTSCIIQPCLHMVCVSCMEKLSHYNRVNSVLKCPLCRCTVQSAVSASNSTKVSTNRKGDMKLIPNPKSNLGDVFFHVLMRSEEETFGVSRSLKKVLEMLILANDINGGGTLRVMLISSEVNISEGEFSEGYVVVPYVAKGTRNSPSRRKNLESTLRGFQEDDGRCKLLIAKDPVVNGIEKIDDNMTGLDFPSIQAVISLGSVNRAQRIGRLCRLSRMGLPRAHRDAIYVELFRC